MATGLTIGGGAAVPVNDDPAPDQSLPLFLSSDTEETGQRGSSRIFWTGFLILIAWAVGGATLLLGDPGSRIAAFTASFSGAPATGHDEAAPPAQPVVAAQVTPPAETQPPGDQQPAAAAAEPAEPKQADVTIDRDALFRQFQAWAQQQGSKPDQQQDPRQESQMQTTRELSAQPAPPQPAAVTTRSVATRVEPKPPAPAVQAPVRAAQKQRPARELRNARAEMEAARRAKEKAGQTYWTPTEEPRAPDTPAQNPDTPWLLRLFGGHN
jgi:hypothetical protein